MEKNKNHHTFHIPVMGTGFTIDTPLKVAHYGINSVISLADDVLIERMRELYSNKLGLPFQAISDKIEDFRARRITAYLNMMDGMISEKFEKVCQSFQEMGDEWEKYVEMLPDISGMKDEVRRKFHENTTVRKVQDWFKTNFKQGTIDVNIMTKLDREHYSAGEQLPVEYNDAHAAVRGFGMSNLESSIVFSAGMNPRLYNYLEKFDDFYPDETGYIRKKIILKVSDYRSAQIQGKYLAKKGLWVSEYRIESGLNCGGHAFATNGALIGPILESFKTNREILTRTAYELLVKGLTRKNRTVPESPLELKITAQGGVGSSQEHQFLLDYYNLDSIGWGTPFLMVPEVANVDPDTLSQLSAAKEQDLYLSGISPLGVPFNSLRGNTRDQIKRERIEKGDPGSLCPRGILRFDREFSDRGVCTASRQYQRRKLQDLEGKEHPPDVLEQERGKVMDKSCICAGLGLSALLVNSLDTSVEGDGVSICPGPNMAYFSRIVSLKEMVDYIYGRISGLARADRPSMFVTELRMYVNYLRDKLAEIKKPIADKQREYFLAFGANLEEGIRYYRDLSQQLKLKMKDGLADLRKDLESLEQELMGLRDALTVTA